MTIYPMRLLKQIYAPLIDEYKSSSLKRNDEKSQQLRRDIRDLILENECKIGLILSHTNERNNISNLIPALINKIVDENALAGNKIKLFADRGLFKQKSIDLYTESGIIVSNESDSKKILGIQAADYVAHTASTILIYGLGLKVKNIEIGRYNPINPDEDAPLQFSLWSDIRSALSSERTIGPWDLDPELPSPYHYAFGILISDECPDNIRRVALDWFSTVWLGCID